MTKGIFLIVLMAVPLSAELRRVEMRLTGLDCNTCGESVDKVMKRNRGVDTVIFDSKFNVVTLTLKLDNKTQLSAIRDSAKSVGYTPGDVKVKARGSLMKEGGQWQFVVSGPETKWKVEMPEDLAKSAGPDVVVDGTLAEKTPDVLQIHSITKAE